MPDQGERDRDSLSPAQQVNQAVGRWLEALAPWDVFSTWTFSRLVRVHGAMYWARRHLNYLEKTAQQPIYAFVGVEPGQTGGLLHVHALLGNVAHLKAYCGERLEPGKWGCTCCMVHSWPAGIARVLPYDPNLGAAHYVSKYITKWLAEWELVGFPPSPQISLDRVCANRVPWYSKVGEREEQWKRKS